ncbi:MAG: DUF362 domain-containing protein [Candidatus Thorarchaeota archaeon]
MNSSPIDIDTVQEKVKKNDKDAIDSVKLPYVAAKNCTGCAWCIRACPIGAISIIDRIAYIDPTKCMGCLKCMVMCPKETIVLPR